VIHRVEFVESVEPLL